MNKKNYLSFLGPFNGKKMIIFGPKSGSIFVLDPSSKLLNKKSFDLSCLIENDFLENPHAQKILQEKKFKML